MFPLKLACRYLSKPAPITIALLIAIGAVSYITILGVTEGLREYWMKQLLGLRSHVTLTVKNLPEGVRGYRSLVEQLEKIPGIAVASPFREDTCFAFTDASMHTICPVRAIRLEDLVKYGTIRANVHSDHFIPKVIDGVTVPACIVGKDFADSMHLEVGSLITLMTDVNPSGHVTPNFKQFYIQEIRHDVADIFDRDIWIDFNEGRSLMGDQEGFIRGISIFLKDNDPDSPMLEPVRQQALAVFKHHIQTDPNYDIPDGAFTREGYLNRAMAQTWKEIDRSWYENAVWNSQISRIAVFIVMTLLALFMLFFMSVLVRDKRRDIGILMATGTTAGQIAGAFLWLAAMVTAIALLIGLPVGWWLAGNINPVMTWFANHGMPIITSEMLNLRAIPVSSHMSGEYVTIVLFDFTVMMAASIWPAVRAAATNPVRTLHYE
ncbi:MAG: ABC transporter permease [Planctomycetota bacterium]